MNAIREYTLLNRKWRFRAVSVLVISFFIVSLPLSAQQAGTDEINPQITSNGGEIQEGEFGSMFSTIGDPVASDSVALDVDGGEASWTGFWQIMPTDTTAGVFEEWAGAGTGATGITSAAPNPFSEEIMFYIRLESPGQVRLSAYDMLGREAQLLIDGHRETGTSRVRWQPEGIDPGIYVIKLEVNNTQYPTTKVQYIE